MPNSSEENYVSIDVGIKSISISQLEECIATAIANAISGSKLNCHVTKLEASGIHGVKLKIELSNDLGDVPF